MARALAANGANKVFIIGRREEALQKTASSVPTSNIISIVGDVTSKESLSACLEQVKSQADHLDVLVANSGISGPGVAYQDQSGKPLPFDEFAKNMWNPSPEEVNSTYAVNITGVHFTIAAFLPLLHAANQKRPEPRPDNFTPRPQIIVTGSIGGFSRQPKGNLSYGPSKAAVMHMMKQLAVVLSPYDIRANIIAPGLYYSEMTEKMYKAEGKVETHNVEGTFDKSQIPATRSGDDEDMAGCILWLCSRAGAYINGNVLVTDGGRLGTVPGSY